MKNVLLIMLMLSSVIASAQDSNPVKWTFSSKKGANANEYVLVATAKIQDGFHVFAPEPGGDGLLIPTEATITNKSSFKKISPLTPQRRPITKNMEGVGYVNFYEGEIEFMMTVETDKPTNIIGVMSFQCCNDHMCLAPTDAPFKVKL